MKKLFLVCLLMLTGSVWAEWVLVNKLEDIQFFYDPTTIRNEGNMRRVWTLQNLKQRGAIGEMSRRIRQEFDCKQERYQLLDISEHSEPMAGGKVLTTGIGSGVWRGIAPGTNSTSLLEIICSK
jgi:hypothetical protein